MTIFTESNDFIYNECTHVTYPIFKFMLPCSTCVLLLLFIFTATTYIRLAVCSMSQMDFIVHLGERENEDSELCEASSLLLTDSQDMIFCVWLQSVLPGILLLAKS